MTKWHIQNTLTDTLKSCERMSLLNEEEQEQLYVEVRNLTLQNKIDQFLEKYLSGSEKIDNSINSIILWTLGVTDSKPNGMPNIKSQGSFADFDIDFSKEKRFMVKDYLKEKYGKDRVADVVTYSTLTARAAVRSAQRALGLSLDLASKLTKLIPDVPDIKLQEAIDASDSIKKIIKDDPDAKKIIDIARKFEGLPNALGVHACAFVITDKEMVEYLPQMIATKKDGADIITQFEYYDVEAIGCLKYDLLGLKTLDVIDQTVKLVKQRHNVDIDIHGIDMNDPKIYEVINEGHNTGIFQFESDLFQQAVKQVKPQNINEFSDLTSLLRPGPMSMGMLQQYIDAKFTGNKYRYKLNDDKLIEKVWNICGASYGLMVYQEQVIKCFAEIGGFNEIEADNARRAMGKKKPEEMEKLKQKFADGGILKGYKEKDLAELFLQIEGFAGYGFNRSHAVCYSVLTCQTAYLSACYPLEFYTTLLTIDSEKTDDVRRYVSAIKQRGFTVSAPRVNTANVDFTISDQDILFGLSGIKGVGRAVSTKILKKRPKKGYKSLGNFILKNLDVMNKKILEQYAKAGVFADFGINKASAIESVRDILDFLDQIKAVSESYTIFDLCSDIDLASYIDTCKIRSINKEDDLAYEVDTLGLYITKHPLEDFVVNETMAIDVKDLNWLGDGTDFHSVGAICAIDVRKTKNKTNMATFDLTGPLSSVRCTVFPKSYEKFINVISEGKVVVIRGFVKEEEESKTFIVNEIISDYSRYISKIKAKTSNFIKWMDVESVNENSEKEIGIEVNKSLSYILER